MASQVSACMKPRAREDGRYVRLGILIGWMHLVLPADHLDSLAIPLFHHPKTAEFAFHPVEEAVVIGVTYSKAIPAYVIVRDDAFDDMYRERHASYPRTSREPVGDVELRRWHVLDFRFRAEVIRELDEQ